MVSIKHELEKMKLKHIKKLEKTRKLDEEEIEDITDEIIRDTPKEDFIKQMDRFENNQKKIDQDKKELAERSRVKIQLPQKSQSFTDFVDEIVAGINKNNSDLFYRPRYGIIVENTVWYDKVAEQEVNGLREVKIPRLINLLEEKFRFYVLVVKDEEFVNVYKELPKKYAELLMENTAFLESLPKIDRIFKSALPYKINGELVLPKEGWDEKLDSFLVKNSPEIKEIDVEEAKKIILSLYKEFCFKEEKDKEFAVAHLLTPGCRGIYNSVTARTPVHIYQANRERCGKDYCAGIVSIVYEGYTHDNPPMSTDERNSSGGSDELRKKMTAVIKRGGRIYHSANNKGRINNAFFEQVLTSEKYNDRELGKNKEIELNNEVDFSISANKGISFTADLEQRGRKIELFYAEEDINKRIFENPDLHGFIKNNRSKILSAIYTLIKTWYDAGEPSGGIFTSFHEWARVVGGIMKYHKLGDPCIKIESDDIGGDTESREMKDFFIYMAEVNIENLKGVEKKNAYTIGEIIDYVTAGQLKGESFFPEFNLERPGDRISLAIKLRKYLGRELGGIKFNIFAKNSKKYRETYKFGVVEVDSGVLPATKPIEEVNNSGGDKTPQTPPTTPIKEEFVNDNNSETISEPIQQPQKKRPKTEQMNWLDTWIPKDDTKSEISIIDLIDSGVTQEQIDECKSQNLIFEPKSGFIMRF